MIAQQPGASAHRRQGQKKNCSACSVSPLSANLDQSVEFHAVPVDDVKAPRCICTTQVLRQQAEEGVSVVWGGDKAVPCQPIKFSEQERVLQNPGSETEFQNVATGLIRRLSWIDRYLAVWIFAAMVIGVVLGTFVPDIKEAWEFVEVDTVSLPIAIGLWWMMLPILCKVRFELMWKLVQNRGLVKHVLLSLVFNWLIGPLLMTGLAWGTLLDLSGYRNGIILVGIARCIAMVLVWNQLAGGNTEFCAILVAVNSVLQIAFYSPLAIFYLKIVSSEDQLEVKFWTVAKSVLLFLGVPLAAAMIIRTVMRKAKGGKWYDDSFLPWFGPTALLGLLFTIFVMFSLQGSNIVDNIGEVVRVAVPLLLYVAITFTSTMLVCWWLGIPYPDTVTQCFTASSNNFELAIAVAVASFGIGSDEALAAVVGLLIEVPVLIGLVRVSMWLEKRLKWSTSKLVIESANKYDGLVIDEVRK
eukprot:TRINITY_DN2866_c0_g1_i1.p1 TRINITY_DN2866_c0_g1~~TRINITY_DN2866_c0_g1_i1.p1  ORF type:complete len:470 (-),score=61.04 TRINITY_DN2866_c0_g1_i1:357-1766(-)